MPKFPQTRASGPVPAIVLDTLLDRARTLHANGDRDEVRSICRRILGDQPAHARAMHLLGLSLARDGLLPEAIGWFEKSVRISPGSFEGWMALGDTLGAEGAMERSLDSYDRAAALQPRNGEALFRRAGTLYFLGRFALAAAAYETVLTLTPNTARIANNRALALFWSGRRNEAYDHLNAAIALDPTHVHARFNKSNFQLTEGDLANGFRGLEERWNQPGTATTRRKFAQPLWLGESSLAGKTILLHWEQGFGDTIQFCRYATLAAEAGARVILDVQPALAALMRSLRGAISVITSEDETPSFDLQCPLMSLPLAFGTTLSTIPATSPYLCADPSRGTQARSVRPRVGLAWSSNRFAGDAKFATMGQRKSMPLAALAPLAGLNCDFVSLQIGPGGQEAADPPPGMVLRNDTGRIRDFD